MCMLHHRTCRYLNVSDNALEGALPSLPTGLVSVDISSNKLTGSLPSDMSSYEGLVDIQAYYNSIEGELPHRLPPHLIQLALTGNRLTGSVPPLPRGMKYLSLAENALQGPLPNGPGAAQLWFVSFVGWAGGAFFVLGSTVQGTLLETGVRCNAAARSGACT